MKYFNRIIPLLLIICIGCSNTSPPNAKDNLTPTMLNDIAKPIPNILIAFTASQNPKVWLKAKYDLLDIFNQIKAKNPLIAYSIIPKNVYAQLILINESPANENYKRRFLLAREGYLMKYMSFINKGNETELDKVVTEIKKMGGDAIPRFIEALIYSIHTSRSIKHWEKCRKQIIKFGNDSLLILYSWIIKEPLSPNTREQCFLTLLSIKTKESSLVLDKLFKSNSTAIRKAFAKSIGISYFPSLNSYLIKFSKDNTWQVRAEAALAMGKIKNIDFADYLIPLINDPDNFVAKTGISSLDKIRPPKAIPHLISKLNTLNNDILKITSINKNLKPSDSKVASNKNTIDIEIRNDKLESLTSLRDIVVKALKNITGEDFGYNYIQWRNWYAQLRK